MLNKMSWLNKEKATFNDIRYDDISKMSKSEQLKTFWTDKLVTCKIPVSNPILLNLLNLPGNPNKATKKYSVLTAAVMEKLKKASKVQSELVQNLLRIEMFEICQSLPANQYSHYLELHVTSQFQVISKASFHVTKSGIVIERSMLLHRKRRSWVKSFEDYARFLYHVIMKLAEPYSRCYIVTDRYFPESLKEEDRDNRSSCVLVFLFFHSMIPHRFQQISKQIF